MNDILQEQDINVYASDAETIQTPPSTDYARGVRVGRTIPAKWWNALFNIVTSKLHTAYQNMHGMFFDVVYAITNKGIVPDASDSSQLTTAIRLDADEQTDSYVVVDKRKTFQASEVLYRHEFSFINYIDSEYNQTNYPLHCVTKGHTGFMGLAKLARADYPSDIRTYLVYSADGAHWTAVYSLSNIILTYGNSWHAFYVGICPFMYTSEAFYVSILGESAGGGYNEYIITSEDCFNWTTIFTARKETRPNYTPVLSASADPSILSDAIFYYSACSNLVYTISNADHRVLYTSTTATELGMGTKASSYEGYDNVYMPYYTITYNGVRSYVLGNVIIEGNAGGGRFNVTTIIRPNNLRPYIYLKVTKLKNGNIAVLNTLCRGDNWHTGASGSSWCIVSPDQITELSDLTDWKVLQLYENVPGYFVKLTSTDNQNQKICDVSLDGINYFRLPFTVAADATSILYDNGKYYIISGSKIYSAITLSASVDDYELVLDLGFTDSHIDTVSALFYMGKAGNWLCTRLDNQTLKVGHVVIKNYGTRLYRGTVRNVIPYAPKNNIAVWSQVNKVFDLSYLADMNDADSTAATDIRWRSFTSNVHWVNNEYHKLYL